MDIVHFLELPVDIRSAVYYHLDGQFTNVKPDDPDLLSNVFKAMKSTGDLSLDKKRLLRKLYPRYKPYLEMFEYDPELIVTWLQYSSWLRYDAVILDCLRLNHSLDAGIMGPFDWIYMGEDTLKIGYFQRTGFLLQVWYSKLEYTRWIVESEKTVGEYNPEIEYLRFNMDYISPTMRKGIMSLLHKKNEYSSIYEVWFGDDSNSSDQLEEKFSLMDDADANLGNRESSADGPTRSSLIFDDVADTPNPPKRRKRGRPPKNNVPVISLKKEMPKTTPLMKEIIKRTLPMKNLRKITSRGYNFYEVLINGHGVKERSGSCLNYLVRRRILLLELLQVPDLSKTCVPDFSKWDNLETLVLNNIGCVRLEEIILPPKCSTISVKNCPQVIWWDMKSELNNVIKSLDRLLTKVCPDTMGRCSATECKHDGTFKRITTDNPGLLYQARKVFWDRVPFITRLNFENIASFNKTTIVLPRTLYFDHRAKFFTCRGIEEVILL
ncbi:Ctf13p KNAG_0E02480 [Huiozyma naganishii CBS 8797]|uniref:Uncharacterized protein n=1 Tax=Huiozyma naganishii (strain ATCC MYA-139 / BCRC 22969 / CBS 8797 / KCTC 17520 / NBRC 10181 / NCYC 3082 / Yp74L-3) TaxID=1071383 RepID=J7RLU8_HUIN7|nr:hypothetical protein KNAG_0E02480 [Kazachstania naganishii CBS 8797]CCK70508.1 hypothetical protein KNAG_0E02480 [Kazachstania naganishii CBS 8797]